MAEVSVILPVYNAMPLLTGCLDSLLAQDLEPDLFEVIAVDDGSTDGSGEVLDEYAGRFHRCRVLHQENSGWAGGPRNRALELATTPYVFFMDADDRLGPEALRRLLARAHASGNDIVIPRIEEDGRPGVTRYGSLDTDHATLPQAFRVLMPMKLFRRQLLTDHGIRFPEGRVPLEDGIVMSQAYPRARGISIAGDYVYYLKSSRGAGQLSLQPKDPTAYVSSLRTMIGNVRELTDARTADGIAGQLYRNKGIRRIERRAAAKFSDEVLGGWVRELAALARDEVPTDNARMSLFKRLLSAAIRSEDVDTVRALIKNWHGRGVPLDAGPNGPVAVLAAGRLTVPLPASTLRLKATAAIRPKQPTRASLHVTLEPANLRMPTTWTAQLRSAGVPGGSITAPVQRETADTALLDLTTLSGSPPAPSCAVHVALTGTGGAVIISGPIKVPGDAAPASATRQRRDAGWEFYRSNRGYLRVRRVRRQSSRGADALRRRAPRLARRLGRLRRMGKAAARKLPRR